MVRGLRRRCASRACSLRERRTTGACGSAGCTDDGPSGTRSRSCSNHARRRRDRRRAFDPSTLIHDLLQKRLGSGFAGLLTQRQQVAGAGAPHLLGPRVGLLFRAQLQHRPPVVLDELVDRVDVRRVGGHAHLRADAERVDRARRQHQFLDLKFVQSAAGEDPGVWQLSFVESIPRLARKGLKVPAVEPDPDASGDPEFLDHLDRVVHTVQRVVGVHQEGRALRVILREGTERLGLGIESLYKGMRHGSGRAQAVTARRLNVRGRGEPHHRAVASHRHGGLDALCSS